MRAKDLAFIAIGAALAITPAAALTTFDGSWSVQVLTEQGDCDPVYRYPVAIDAGAVTYDGLVGANVDGNVNEAGEIAIRVEYQGESVDAVGQMDEAAGAGTWELPSRGCTGSWNAERAG